MSGKEILRAMSKAEKKEQLESFQKSFNSRIVFRVVAILLTIALLALIYWSTYVLIHAILNCEKELPINVYIIIGLCAVAAGFIALMVVRKKLYYKFIEKNAKKTQENIDL